MICIKCNETLVTGAIYCHICGKKQIAEQRKHRKRANGTGTVYKLSDKRKKPWIAKKDGVIIGYYETQKEAMENLNALSQRSLTDKYNMSFSDVYNDWKVEKFRDLTVSGITGYEIAYKQFAELHDKLFRTLRTADFQKCVDAYVAKGRKHSTVNKLKQLIGQMSKYAIREEIATTNFAPYIRLPEQVKVTKKVFTDEDIAKLKASQDDTAKLTLMLIYSGMRIGELFTLRCDDVYDTYCIGGEKTESGRNRIIPIHPEVREFFAYFKKNAGDKELLIEGYVGNHKTENFRKRDYYPMLNFLGIERKSPHTARHTFATLAVKSGMRPEHLQKILGHSQYNLTADVYVHADIDTLVKATERVAS